MAALGRCRPPLADYAEGHDFRSDRRTSRCPHDLAARMSRRRAQLGLSLLLAPRRHVHALFAARDRLHRGSGGLSRLAPPGRRRRSLRTADHVQHRRERRLTELELPWLAGYEGSKPVRTGNAACGSFNSTCTAKCSTCCTSVAGTACRTRTVSGTLSASFVFLDSAWREPDEGIWEMRGPRRHFTHSKVMAWVAFDRGLRLIEEFGRTARRSTGASAGRDPQRGAPAGFDPD